MAARASTGPQAIEQVEQTRPDVVLINIWLQHPKEGIEAAEQIRKRFNIPVIYVTAHDDTDTLGHAKITEPFGYILKPFDEAALHVTIEIACYKHEMEEKLKHTMKELERLIASKDKFFSIIAHDLRGPITSLNELTQLTAENLDRYSPEQLRRIINVQQKATESLVKLLENLLTWSRIQRGLLTYAPEPIKLRNLVARNIALFAAMADQKQFTLTHSVPEDIVVYADLNMADTVVRNLISNALKFTHPGGTVEISARQDEGSVEVAVSDTGIGIKKEHLPKLFQIEAKYKRVGTNQEPGTGLGLILCKELVERNGGKIWVESEVGKGSTFFVRLLRETTIDTTTN